MFSDFERFHSFANGLALAVLLLLFAAYSMTVTIMKGDVNLTHFEQPEIFDSVYRQNADLTAKVTYRGEFRATSAMLGRAIQSGFEGLKGLVFTNVTASPEYRDEPWLGDDRSGQANGPLVPLATVITFGLVAMAPILIVTLIYASGMVARFLLLSAVMGALLGWHPAVVTAFFNIMSLFADWPRGYFLFGWRLFHYDFGAVAAVLLMALYLARRKEKKWWEIAAIGICAQFTFEYLGLLFATAVFLCTAHETRAGDGWKAALKLSLFRSVVAISGAVAVAGSVILILFSGGASLISKGAYVSLELGLQRIMETGPKFIIANGLSVLGLAFIAGVCSGALSRAISERAIDSVAVRRDLSALAALSLAFLPVLIIGAFTVHYPSEFSRQLVPLAVLMVLLGDRLAVMGVNAAMRG